MYVIKMSFQLSLLSSSKSDEFSLKDIEALVDGKKQNWFKQAHIGKFLRINNIQTSLNALENADETRAQTNPTYFTGLV